MAYQDQKKIFSDTLVQEVMTRALVSVDPSTTLYQISKMMEQGGMGSILVKKDDIPSGIITDRDFAIKIASHRISMDTPVEQAATFPLLTINANDSILNAARIMSSKKIRKLVVIEEGNIVGIISTTDLINQL